MPSRPRVAVRGAGRMAGAFAASCRVLGWPIDSVSSRTPERASALAGSFDARSATLDEQLTDPLPDLAIVATPPADHVAAGRAWAGAGVPVVIATPLAATLGGADELVDAADRTSTPMLFASNPVMAPAVQELFRRLPDLGPPTHMTGRSIRPSPDWGGFLSDRWSGGVLAHPGTHHVALALLVGRLAGFGAPSSVTAGLDGIATGRSDVGAKVTVAFDSGLGARLELAWRDDVSGSWDLQLASERSVLRLDMIDEPVLEVDGEAIPLPVPPGPDEVRNLAGVGLTPMLRTFWADVEAGRAPVMGMAFGREVLGVVAAAYASAGAAGAKVPLPFAGPRDMTPLALHAAARNA